MFIVLEGIDGSGKTSQMKILKDYFNKKGKEVITIHEPGGTPSAEILRNLILNPDYNFQPRTITWLFEAARNELIESVIEPALKENKIVICDRFTLSTLTYQGTLTSFTENELQLMNSLATKSIQPDITIVFDGDPVNFLKRRNTRNVTDRFEKEPIDFQITLRKKYLKFAHKFKNFYIIDAEQPIDTITKKLIHIIEEKVKLP